MRVKRNPAIDMSSENGGNNGGGNKGNKSNKADGNRGGKRRGRKEIKIREEKHQDHRKDHRIQDGGRPQREGSVEIIHRGGEDDRRHRGQRHSRSGSRKRSRSPRNKDDQRKRSRLEEDGRRGRSRERPRGDSNPRRSSSFDRDFPRGRDLFDLGGRGFMLRNSRSWPDLEHPRGRGRQFSPTNPRRGYSAPPIPGRRRRAFKRGDVRYRSPTPPVVRRGGPLRRDSRESHRRNLGRNLRQGGAGRQRLDMRNRGEEDRRMDALCWELPRVMDEEEYYGAPCTFHDQYDTKPMKYHSGEKYLAGLRRFYEEMRSWTAIANNISQGKGFKHNTQLSKSLAPFLLSGKVQFESCISRVIDHKSGNIWEALRDQNLDPGKLAQYIRDRRESFKEVEPTLYSCEMQLADFKEKVAVMLKKLPQLANNRKAVTYFIASWLESQEEIPSSEQKMTLAVEALNKLVGEHQAEGQKAIIQAARDAAKHRGGNNAVDTFNEIVGLFEQGGMFKWPRRNEAEIFRGDEALVQELKVLVASSMDSLAGFWGKVMVKRSLIQPKVNDDRLWMMTRTVLDEQRPSWLRSAMVRLSRAEQPVADCSFEAWKSCLRDEGDLLRREMEAKKNVAILYGSTRSGSRSPGRQRFAGGEGQQWGLSRSDRQAKKTKFTSRVTDDPMELQLEYAWMYACMEITGKPMTKSCPQCGNHHPMRFCFHLKRLDVQEPKWWPDAVALIKKWASDQQRRVNDPDWWFQLESELKVNFTAARAWRDLLSKSPRRRSRSRSPAHGLSSSSSSAASSYKAEAPVSASSSSSSSSSKQRGRGYPASPTLSRRESGGERRFGQQGGRRRSSFVGYSPRRSGSHPRSPACGSRSTSSPGWSYQGATRGMARAEKSLAEIDKEIDTLKSLRAKFLNEQGAPPKKKVKKESTPDVVKSPSKRQ